MDIVVAGSLEALQLEVWGQLQIDSLLFMKPEIVVRERGGWVTQRNCMIAAE